MAGERFQRRAAAASVSNRAPVENARLTAGPHQPLQRSCMDRSAGNPAQRSTRSQQAHYKHTCVVDYLRGGTYILPARRAAEAPPLVLDCHWESFAPLKFKGLFNYRCQGETDRDLRLTLRRCAVARAVSDSLKSISEVPWAELFWLLQDSLMEFGENVKAEGLHPAAQVRELVVRPSAVVGDQVLEGGVAPKNTYAVRGVARDRGSFDVGVAEGDHAGKGVMAVTDTGNAGRALAPDLIKRSKVRGGDFADSFRGHRILWVKEREVKARHGGRLPPKAGNVKGLWPEIRDGCGSVRCPTPRHVMGFAQSVPVTRRGKPACNRPGAVTGVDPGGAGVGRW